MKRWVLLAVPLVALGVTPLASGQELTVQRTWRVGAVGLGLPDDVDVTRLLRQVEAGIARELPGLDVKFDTDAFRNYPAPAQTDLTDGALVRHAIARSEADGLRPASYDVVFLLSPLLPGPYLGRSHVSANDREGRPVRGAYVQTDPGGLVLAGLLDTLADRAPAPGFSRQQQQLPAAVRRLLLRLLKTRSASLLWLLRRPRVRDALVGPVLAHEFGHFLAPGDLDVRDGYQAPWLAHATRPDDNPDGHALECCMYKGRSASFYGRKALAHLRRGGRLILFCDLCRARLGCE